ncbi:hypothetical protein IQ07DRAFT_139405 [Pyrenochaeta sp. DS3sAY3a]|nr:hypothetical protein IQ07DRAFT_139405 [Pyrenochaeta sp. DS3sAY3a]
MLFSHFVRLCITSASLIAATPLQAAPTVASIPSSLPNLLQEDVPLCAQSCLQASLAERFPVACVTQTDIACLCSRYSNMGESLGEVALGCIYSSCSTVDQSAASAYNVCLGQKDAVRPTKTALTVVASSAPRTTSTRSPGPFTTTTPSVSGTFRTPILPTQSIFADSISVTPSATSLASTTSVPAASASEEGPRMTPAQIAGLSVAAVAAFILAIGLMALSVCLRRRKERKFAFDTDEKGQRKGKKQSARFSHYVAVDRLPEPPSSFPMTLHPALRNRPELQQDDSVPRLALGPFPSKRPVQRLGVGTSNSSSNSSLPLDQIGLAISAELDGKPAVRKNEANTQSRPQHSNANQPDKSLPYRPISSMTQDTVFEEDDAQAKRTSSILLPTPPVPIPPIRSLQPSRPDPTLASNPRQSMRPSELFLDIPLRHERPQPKRIITAEMPSAKPAKSTERVARPRLAPPIQMTSSTTVTTASSRDPSTSGDILDYYLTTNQEFTPRANPAHIVRPKESPRTIQIRSKKSQSTVSRTASRASTNNRDSLSSQTSFETLDPNDPTPDDEDDDKQLSDDNKQQLSPVAESPISNLRYPKVPRASNQLVARSPRSPQSHGFKSPPSKQTQTQTQAQTSPRRPLEAASLLQKRHHDLPPLLLESRPRLNSPPRDPFRSPPRRARTHKRSTSTESWTATPASKKLDRASRVQSGAWGRSPVMYEEDVVQPLNVRRRRDEMKEVNIGRDVDVDGVAEGLKSPVWVPRLTPSRKGEDLYISVK